MSHEVFRVIRVSFGDPVTKVVEVGSVVYGTLERQCVPGSAVWGFSASYYILSVCVGV